MNYISRLNHLGSKRESDFLMYRGDIYMNFSTLSNLDSCTFLMKIGETTGNHIPWDEVYPITLYVTSTELEINDICYETKDKDFIRGMIITDSVDLDICKDAKCLKLVKLTLDTIKNYDI